VGLRTSLRNLNLRPWATRLRSHPALFPRQQQRITVKGNFPFVGKPFKMKGYDLGRYNDYALVDFGTGALVFGGVNIAEPGSLEVISPNAK